jgi:thioredoxin 1
MAKEFTDFNFEKEVEQSETLTMVDFWAEWCGPCRAIAPIIDQLESDYADRLNVGKINVDTNPLISVKYNITSIPAILFIKGGEVVDKQMGAVPKAALIKKIEKHL